MSHEDLIERLREEAEGADEDGRTSAAKVFNRAADALAECEQVMKLQDEDLARVSNAAQRISAKRDTLRAELAALREQAAAELLRQHELIESLQAALAQPADLLDTPIPCDITVGSVTHKRGTALRAVVDRMQAMHRMLSGFFDPLNPVALTAAQPAEPNLSDPAVQKRLAAQWGYVTVRRPMTDEQIAAMRKSGYIDEGNDSPWPWDYARGVRDAERAHGIGESHE